MALCPRCHPAWASEDTRSGSRQGHPRYTGADSESGPSRSDSRYTTNIFSCLDVAHILFLYVHVFHFCVCVCFFFFIFQFFMSCFFSIFCFCRWHTKSYQFHQRSRWSCHSDLFCKVLTQREHVGESMSSAEGCAR